MNSTTVQTGSDLPPVSGRMAWWTVAILVVLYTLSMLDRQLITLMVDLVRADLHLTDFQISLLLGPAFVITFTLAGLPLGYAADRFQRRHIIAGGVFVWSLATMMCGLSRNFGQLFGARLGIGVGEAALVPASHSMISDLYPPERRTFPLSVFQVSASVGAGLSLALGGLVVSISLKNPELAAMLGVRSWQLAFILISIPSLFAGLFVYLIREPTRGETPQRDSVARDPLEVLRFMRLHWRFFTGHFLGFALLVALVSASLAWSPTFVHRTYGWTLPQAGSALGAVSIVTALVGGLGVGAFVQRLYSRGRRDAHLRYQALSCILIATLGTGTYLAPTAPLYFIGLTLTKTLALIPLNVTSAASLQIVAPNHLRGQLAAILLVFISLLGTGLGPVLVGAITDFGFADDLQVGASLAVMFAVIAPISGLLLWSAMPEMRSMIAAQGKPATSEI